MNAWDWLKEALRDDPTIIVPIALVLLGLWKLFDIFLFAIGVRAFP